MKRLLFILSLICSVDAFAQHYTVEYWYDYNYGNRDTVSVDTSALQMQLDVGHLDGGTHLLHMQIYDTTRYHYAPMSFVFYNSNSVDSVEYRMWFDYDYPNGQIGHLGESTTLIDINSLTNGLHTMNLQVGSGQTADLHGYLFYKHMVETGASPSVEYICWFDQDYTHSQTGTLNSGSIMLNVDSLTNGVHTINWQLNSGNKTELRSYLFFKHTTLDSVFSHTQYLCWFDQNHTSKQSGILGNGIFLLGVDSLENGIHAFNLQLGEGLDAELHNYIFYKSSSNDSAFSNTEYVCWFDQNYDGKQTGIIGTGNLLFDVDSIEGGIHIFNLQIGNGLNGELHSYVFYKELDYDSIFRNTEYVRWFDQDYANKQVGIVDSGSIFIDISSMPIGPHYLNLQFGEGEDSELRSFLFYKVDTFYDTAILDVCDWTLWYDSIYTVSGEYGQEREAILPNCYDTVATLYLNVRYSSAGDTAAIVCDTFSWYGNIYTASAMPMHHTTNMAGCDSTTTLNLTINYSTIGDTLAIVCDSFMWYGITYISDTMPVCHTTNALGCDSTVMLNLTVNYSSEGDTFAVVCDSFLWHGITYIADTMSIYHLTNSFGCDSLLTLNLTVPHSSTGDTSAVACDMFEWYGTEYLESTDSAMYTITNTAGCDSVVTLYLTINHSTIDTVVVSTSGSYEWQGYTFDTSGIYSDSLLTMDGCDSILVLQLSIMQSIQDVNERIVTVYPNPTSGKVKVDTDDVIRIDVYNANGQLLKTVVEESVIDISNIPAGVYTLRVKTIRSMFICKVLKQ